MKRFVAIVIAIVLGSFTPTAGQAAPPLKVGSKRFTESYILAEIVIALAKAEGLEATHEQGLGGTAVTERALEDGAIDVYPEYTGTIAEAIVKEPKADVTRMRSLLESRGILLSESLGFQNRYALATNRAANITKTSDLIARGDLAIGLSPEFAGRSDGWPGLAAHYGIPNERKPSAIDHALAYEALTKGNIAVTDVYTTDAKIARYDLVVLEDDKHFFPSYEAVLLYRKSAQSPAFTKILERLKSTPITEDTMRKLNARAELDGVSFDRVAKEHLSGTTTNAGRASFAAGLVESITRYGPRHLALVLGALLLSTLFGVPLGILAYANRRSGAAILGITGVVQTIPSLALFCFFIPLLGIGPVPALAALFLYGLLPIVRNTHAGLVSIPSELRDAARAIGLSATEAMWNVELPLASQTLLAGIKTSAVVAVGSATIAAFIGAGGFGEPISTGLSLNDIPTILHGAIPAAGLALVVQGAFAIVEKHLVPRGLRIER